MIRFLLVAVLFILVARAFWRVVDGILEGATGQQHRQVRSGTKLVRDPVCGTYIVPSPSLSLSSGRQTLYFCSEACRAQYRKGARVS